MSTKLWIHKGNPYEARLKIKIIIRILKTEKRYKQAHTKEKICSKSFAHHKNNEPKKTETELQFPTQYCQKYVIVND